MERMMNQTSSFNKVPSRESDTHQIDLYEGYNGYDDQLIFQDRHTPTSGVAREFAGKDEIFAGVHPVAPPSISSSVSDNQGLISCEALDSRSTTIPAAQTLSFWRPPSSGRARALSITSVAPTDASRPITAVKAAGYSSRRSRFDPLNQGVKDLTAEFSKKDDSNPEHQSREAEKLVNHLLLKSAAAEVTGDYLSALQSAKEACKRERLLCKHREQSGLGDNMNMEMTIAVCFNLGHQYHASGLQSEALNVYSQIVKNKQFPQGGRFRVNMGNIYFEQEKYPLAIKMYRMALDQTPNAYKDAQHRIMRNIGTAFMKLGQYQEAVQSYEASMEIRIDHQTGYNLIACYYILGNTDKMRSCFTKLLIVRPYNWDADDELEADQFQNDALQEELRSRQSQAMKYILTAARLIGPIIGNTFVEGYDWMIALLKDQQYSSLAHELEMDKATQHLRKRNYSEAIKLLKEFERQEKSLKARAATNLSFLYYLEGDLSNAERHAELAVRTNRYNACALVNQGNCMFSRGDIEAAKAMYSEAVEVDADCVQARYNLGLTYRKLGLLSDALTAFKQVSKLLPNNVEVLFQIGKLNEFLGNTRQAIKWLEIVNSKAIHDAGVLATLGHLHSTLEDEPKALHYYTESYRVYPVNMDIITWLAAFYVKNEIYEKAIPLFDLASKVQTGEVKWHLMIASCHRQTGAYSLALAKYKDILTSHPENVDCLRNLIHMCTSLGRKEEAQGYKTRLRKAHPGDCEIENLDKQFSTKIRMLNQIRNYGSAEDDTDLIMVANSQGASNPMQLDIVPHSLTSTLAVTKDKSEDDDWELGDDLLPM